MLITNREMVAVLATIAGVAGATGGVIGSELHHGPTGPQGPAGTPGPSGAPGPAAMRCADPVVGNVDVTSGARLNIIVRLGTQSYSAIVDTGAANNEYAPDSVLRAAGYTPYRVVKVGGSFVPTATLSRNIYSVPASAFQALTGSGHWRAMATDNAPVTVVGTLENEPTLLSPVIFAHGAGLSVVGTTWKIC